MIGDRMMPGDNAPGVNTFDNIPEVIRPIACDIAKQIGDIQPTYRLELKLLSKDNFSIDVLNVKSFSLHEEFETNVCDYINLKIQLPLYQIPILEARYKDLKCYVGIFPGDPNETTVIKTPMYEFTWTAIVVNRGSLFKNVTPRQAGYDSEKYSIQSQLVDIDLQLFNPEAIMVKQRKTAGVFRDVDVTSMLYFLCSHMGVQRLDMVKPHNTDTYENFIIDPMHYLNDIFNYIQERYGIYQYGVSTYFLGKNEKDSCLYVYPPHFFDPAIGENDILIEILYVGQRVLRAGAKQHKLYPSGTTEIEYNGVKHKISGGLKILCNDIVSQYTLADSGAENVGTINLVFNANKTIDRWRDIEIDGQNRCVPKHKMEVIDTMKKGHDFTGFTTTHYNPRYDVSYNNGRHISSKLASVDCDVTVFRWYGAEPWTFKPGKRVIFSYGKDDSKYVKQVPGIVSEVVYVFAPMASVKPTLIYCTCTAEVMLKQKREV